MCSNVYFIALIRSLQPNIIFTLNSKRNMHFGYSDGIALASSMNQQEHAHVFKACLISLSGGNRYATMIISKEV